MKETTQTGNILNSKDFTFSYEQNTEDRDAMVTAYVRGETLVWELKPGIQNDVLALNEIIKSTERFLEKANRRLKEIAKSK